MLPEIAQLYSSRIIDEVVLRYGEREDALREIGGFENFVYRSDSAVYRIGHSSRRTNDDILFELGLVTYLQGKKVRVAGPRLSEQDRLVEEIDDGAGGSFMVTAFDIAPGDHPHNTGGWNDNSLADYGRQIGRMHRVTEDYEPCSCVNPRSTWDDPRELRWPEDDAEMSSALSEVVEGIRALSRGPLVYGPVHQDPHAGNLHVNDRDEVTLFDFDDIVYAHYAYDLAMVLFYELCNRDTHASGEERAYADWFWRGFLRAYLDEHPEGEANLSAIPLYARLREIELYTTLAADLSEEERNANSFARAFFPGRRVRIFNGEPPFTIDLAPR